MSWDFDYVDLVEATPDSKDAEVEVAAIEAGAQDFEAADAEDEERMALFITETADLDACRRRDSPWYRPSRVIVRRIR